MFNSFYLFFDFDLFIWWNQSLYYEPIDLCFRFVIFFFSIFLAVTTCELFITLLWMVHELLIFFFCISFAWENQTKTVSLFYYSIRFIFVFLRRIFLIFIFDRLQIVFFLTYLTSQNFMLVLFQHQFILIT